MSEKLKVTTPADRVIRMEREFDAPKYLVFKAYSKPEYIKKWWGSNAYIVEIETMEFKTGGDWKFVNIGKDESDKHVFRGAYREIVENEKISYSFEWMGMPGYVCCETVTFEDLGDDRTKLVTETIFFTTEERDGMLEAMQGGADESMDRLEKLLGEWK